jgi:hypothetical protein
VCRESLCRDFEKVDGGIGGNTQVWLVGTEEYMWRYMPRRYKN